MLTLPSAFQWQSEADSSTEEPTAEVDPTQITLAAGQIRTFLASYPNALPSPGPPPFNGKVAWAIVVGIVSVGLILSIVRVNKARKAGLSDEELRAAVQKAMPLNLGSLFLSVIGLMVVMLGIFLG